jgi:hypothetical protein
MDHMPGLQFRDRLQSEFAARRNKNPRYSVRAFANFLSADHASLSQIMRGRRGIPLGRIPAWAARLGIHAEEAGAYLAAEQLVDVQATARQEQLRHWIEEAAAVLTQPEHYRLLELCRRPDFRPDCRWIAVEIGATVDQIHVALSRLLRLRLLAATSAGAWKDTSGLARLTQPKFRELALAQVRNLATKEETQNAEPSDAVSDLVEKPGRNRALLRGALRLEHPRQQSPGLSAH